MYTSVKNKLQSSIRFDCAYFIPCHRRSELLTVKGTTIKLWMISNFKLGLYVRRGSPNQCHTHSDCVLCLEELSTSSTLNYVDVEKQINSRLNSDGVQTPGCHPFIHTRLCIIFNKTLGLAEDCGNPPTVSTSGYEWTPIKSQLELWLWDGTSVDCLQHVHCVNKSQNQTMEKGFQTRITLKFLRTMDCVLCLLLSIWDCLVGKKDPKQVKLGIIVQCMMCWLKPQTSPRFGLSHSKRRTKIHFSTVSCLRIHLRQLQALLQNLDCFTFAVATKFTILL